MSQKKPTLGRGLADLLGQTALRPATPVPVHAPAPAANGAVTSPSGAGPAASVVIALSLSPETKGKVLVAELQVA